MPRRGTAEPSTTVGRPQSMESIRQDWDRLALATGHPFATWEWNSLWWERFGRDRELYLHTCRDAGGEVVAILPLYVAARRPVRVARFIGYADMHTPLCALEDRPLAAAGLRQVLRGRGSCRMLYAERMPADEHWAAPIGGTTLNSGQCPVLDFGGRSWDEIMAEKKRKMRGNLRRAEAKLISDHGVEFRLADDPERIEDDMHALFRLHALRWGNETTGVFEGERARFHLDFAFAALERGWLRLWLAEKQGEAVGAWYGWRYAGSEWFFGGGRDRLFDNLSLGSVMLVRAMRAACEDGMRTFEFLSGDEAYKWRFATGGSRPGLFGARERPVRAPRTRCRGGISGFRRPPATGQADRRVKRCPTCFNSRSVCRR